MNFLRVLNDPQWWRTLLGSDFNQGFMAALALILLLMVFLMLVRGILRLVFGTRRCSAVVVKRDDGDTVISRDTVAALVNRELASYPAIHCNKIVLTRRRSIYQLTIYCEYLLSDQTGLPAFCDEFKPKLQQALAKSFGITDITGIRLWVDAVPNDDFPPSRHEEPISQAHDAYPGL
ncbi:MAG: hypothetical protein IJT50_14130 [Lentisphaeria bacterium]|nr:hypothetical protein [Lentisphaeria bacterium]